MPPHLAEEQPLEDKARLESRQTAEKDSMARDPDCRKRASHVLDKMHATVASEIQAFKRYRASGSKLEQAGVLRAEDCMELETEILQEYEKLQGQVESSFHNIRVKTEGKLLSPHEKQMAELLDKNRELEGRLEEKEDRGKTLDDKVSSLRATLGQFESKFFKEVGAFGASAWNRYFGDVGEEPLLPQNIVDIMQSPCPFWHEKKIQETHMLALIPATVNGQPFSMDLLETLIQNPKGGGNKTSYQRYSDMVKNQIGKQAVEKILLDFDHSRDFARQHQQAGLSTETVDFQWPKEDWYGLQTSHCTGNYNGRADKLRTDG